MSNFISSVAELFKGKKQETAPVAPPTQTIEQKQQELDNLQKIMNSPAGKDFRSPQTDAQDRNRIAELQGQIAAIKPQEAAPQPQPTPVEQPGITQIPVEQPQQPPAVEEPKVA
jgi:hypothetical protein